MRYCYFIPHHPPPAMPAKTDLRRVEAITASGLAGVRVVSERGASFPTTCDLKDAAILHPTEAARLRKWARAHGIDARTTLHKKGQPAAGRVAQLLGQLL